MTEYTFMEGKPYTGTEEDTMRRIRWILREEAEAEMPAPRRRSEDLPELRPSVAVAQVQPKARATASASRPAVSAQVATLGALPARIAAFRPTTRHLAIVSTLLLMVLRPHWFVIGAVLALALTIAVFMVLGATRIWAAVLRRIDVIEASDPMRGARLRRRLDAFACRWDAFLDLFPDGMVDELYMPDLQGMRDADDRHDRAVAERLDRMAHEG